MQLYFRCRPRNLAALVDGAAARLGTSNHPQSNRFLSILIGFGAEIWGVIIGAGAPATKRVRMGKVGHAVVAGVPVFQENLPFQGDAMLSRDVVVTSFEGK